MNLTDKLKNTKTYISNALIAGALTGLVACGGGPTTPSGPTTPTQVTQTIKVLTSDGRDLGTTTYQGMSNEQMTIRISELATKGINNVASIDSRYAAIRENNTTDNKIGNYVTNTNNGTLTITPTNTTRILWGLNAGTDYGCGARTGTPYDGTLTQREATITDLTPANNTVTNFQVVDGDRTKIKEGVDMLNQAWQVTIQGTTTPTKMGSMNWITNSPNPDFKGGLGIYTPIPSALGVHAGNNWIVNKNIVTPTLTKNVAAVEALESYGSFDDFCHTDDAKYLFDSYLTSLNFNQEGLNRIRAIALMKK